VLSTVVASCAGLPGPNPGTVTSPAESAASSATPLVAVKPSPLRSVGLLGATIAASGDFRGNGKSQVVLLQDPNEDLTLRITVRDANGETFAESTWFTSTPGFFALKRAKFAVADANGDGKDDLVALYRDGASASRLLVFRSTGSTFMPPEVWWQSDAYAWDRVAAVLAGAFGSTDRDQLLLAYQYENAQLKLHSFESTGSSFTYGGSQGVYDSGAGQFDASRARFAVGRFTRTSGPQQIAVLYQLPNAKVRIGVFDPLPSGLALRNGIYETNEGEYDLSRAAISAADVTGDGRDDLVALYADADGSAKVQVFDGAQGFKPVNGWTGWAALPASSVCGSGSAMLVGDWDGDKKPDANAVAPGDLTQVRMNVLHNSGGSFQVVSTSEPAVCARWPLTGLPLAGGSANDRPLYVKIDNNPHARPHYGISKADEVYEWLVEGLTTRLAAVFQSQKPDVIGSVRSARITDAPIVPSLGAAFVYSGGGPEELMRLHYDDAVAHRYVDLSPGYGWGYRVGFREAPYNYFTTYAALKAALASAPGGNEPVDVAPWDFLPSSNIDAAAGGFAASVPASTIDIPYRAGFEVRYQYDPASRTYARFDDGVREVDGANGQAVAARNIIVIQTEVHFTDAYGFDPAGNPKLFTDPTGTGGGTIFRDGRRQEITWSRPDIFDQFQLRNAAGELVRLEPGQTWIHIVPKDWTIPSR
jgi:DUF3048 family protein